MVDRPLVLSAFSGLGGLDLGLEATGFEHLGCIENDETARRSLQRNRGRKWPLLDPGDIAILSRLLTPTSLGIETGQLAMLAGGPPCQPFSSAAQWSASSRTGLQDIRSHCLHDFLSLVERFLPRVVLIENVPGFLRGPVSALRAINKRLAEIDASAGTSYLVESRIVDAASYGVPQRRRRAIIVATRDGERLSWPTPDHEQSPVRAWDAIGGMAPSSDAPRPNGGWTDLLPSIPEGENYLFHTPRGRGRPLFGYRTRYWSFLLKLSKTQPSWTLSAQPGPSTGPFHWDNRPLSIPEMLRLQTFPPDWQVEGKHRDQVRQVGNATPPLLAEIISREIARQLFGIGFNGHRLRYRVPRLRDIPDPSPIEPVPDRYLHLEASHADHPGTGKGPSPRTGRSSAVFAKAVPP